MLQGSHDHAKMAQELAERLPPSEKMRDLSEWFKLFGDYTRIRILCSLTEGELCVGAIAELLGMGQSAVSHQLRVLRDGALLDCRREGKEMIYYLKDDHVRGIIAQGFEHICEKDGEQDINGKRT